MDFSSDHFHWWWYPIGHEDFESKTSKPGEHQALPWSPLRDPLTFLMLGWSALEAIWWQDREKLLMVNPLLFPLQQLFAEVPYAGSYSWTVNDSHASLEVFIKLLIWLWFVISGWGEHTEQSLTTVWVRSDSSPGHSDVIFLLMKVISCWWAFIVMCSKVTDSSLHLLSSCPTGSRSLMAWCCSWETTRWKALC